jgi:hypothetical protein
MGTVSADLSRRDFITVMLTALFLALFPWLRSERGLEAARESAEAAVKKLFDVDERKMRRLLQQWYPQDQGEAFRERSPLFFSFMARRTA